MSSQAQIVSNRLNSQKSTGPTSPEGKAASSLNALKSGIHANSHIIRGEDPAELEALTAAFLLHHQPADPNQLALVDTLIAAEWTQRRLQALQNLVAQASACHVGTHADTAPAPEPASPEETQPLTPPIGFVPPIASPPAQRPPLNQENYESSSKDSLETDRALADQAPSRGHDS